MSNLWAKVDNATSVVLNVECASDEWVADHNAANPDADYTYIPTDPEAPDYAGVGHTWDGDLERFIPPSPFPSFVYDADKYAWVAPIPYPGDETTLYLWDEEQGDWVEYVAPDAE